ncbi:hypothetical protein TWF481_005987 [Arthrobotrys musiformis]|uniref:Pentacotripeptide-repeat region of PRORP domain-containing protein n=1 Tax=Arthrobotrys musiformis TaxID=47236 RepID=A0AAV9WHC9_9PEZI
MLERVAARLNRRGCTLSNVRTASLSSSRMLHSAFWIHGGELLLGRPSGNYEGLETFQEVLLGKVRSLSLALSGHAERISHFTSRLPGPPSPSPADQFTISAFGLDFLYPPQAIALLQRLSIRRSSRNSSKRNAYLPRSYSSFVGDSSKAKREAKIRAELAARQDDEWEYGPSGMAEGFLDKRKRNSRDKFAPSEKKTRSLQSLNPVDFDMSEDSFDRAWAWYSRKDDAPQEPALVLEPNSQRRRLLLGYLANSKRMADYEKIIVFLEDLSPEKRREMDWKALINAYLTLDRVDPAYAALSRLVEQHIGNTQAGFEEFISYCINHDAWDRAIRCWQLLQQELPKSKRNNQSSAEIELRAVPRFQQVQPHLIVKSIPNFMDRYTAWVTNLLDNDMLNRDFATWLFVGVKKNFAQREGAVFEKTDIEQINKLLDKKSWYTPDEKDLEYSILGTPYVENHEEVIQQYSEYRLSPNAHPSNMLLYRVLLASIAAGDFKAMQMVFDDWFRHHNHPTIKAYRQMMDVFAKRGEVNIVEELYKQFSSRFAPTADDYGHILRGYVERGEVATAVEKLEAMPLSKLKPNLECYNILLRGFSQAEDMESAMDYLNMILELGLEPNSGTYGSMMYVCAARGDFENVDLLFRAACKKMRPTVTMWNMIVWSHVNGGARSLAWKLINFIYRQDMGIPMTHMYNMLMSAHANKKELRNVNRIFKEMQEREIPFNFHSYAIMMRALTQTQHRENLQKARQMLDLLQTQNIQTGPVPYATLMQGYLRRRKYSEVFAIYKTMMENGVEPNFSAQSMLLLASIFEAQELAKFTGNIDLSSAEEISRLAIEKFSGFDPTSFSPVKTAVPTYIFTPLISAYIYKEDYDSVRKTYQHFLELSSLKGSNSIKPTMNMYLKLLHASQRERNWTGLREIWRLMYREAQRRGRPLTQISTGSNVVTVKKREMCPAFDIMLKAAIDSLEVVGPEADAITVEEIGKMMQEIITWGFELDGGNWNSLIVLAAKSGDLEQAFRLGESQLVKDTGVHYRIRSQRRFGFIGWAKHAQHPHTHTIDILGGQLGKLFNLTRGGTEEAEKARALAKKIATTCPVMWRICNSRSKRGLKAETSEIHAKVLDFAEIAQRPKVDKLKITRDYALSSFKVQKERYLRGSAKSRVEFPFEDAEYDLED